MAWWGNQVRNERTQQALDAYKEESGITVSGQFYQWGDIGAKWQPLQQERKCRM